ncbi:hypothetical protein DAI22_02g201550 [Oryza sativa Japonica Group]|nr:hypothetical protein DAI22_02g201550 [Oryza sativa Japonica Group]
MVSPPVKQKRSPCVLWKAQRPHDVVRTITTTPSSRCLGTGPSDTTFKTSLRKLGLLDGIPRLAAIWAEKAVFVVNDRSSFLGQLLLGTS